MLSKLILLSAAVLLLTACGAVATPEWAAEVQETQAALAVTAEHLTAIAPTVPPTSTPSATAIPPTATPVPPTATPEAATNTPEAATATFTPTPIPQQAVAETVSGDPVRGDQLFHEMKPQVGFACATCHNPLAVTRLIGPGLQGIGERAATRVEDESAVEYLHNSIVNPNVFISPPDATGPYPENLMPMTYAQVLSEQDINDIIAYLLTL